MSFAAIPFLVGAGGDLAQGDAMKAAETVRSPFAGMEGFGRGLGVLMGAPPNEPPAVNEDRIGLKDPRVQGLEAFNAALASVGGAFRQQNPTLIRGGGTSAQGFPINQDLMGLIQAILASSRS